MGLKKNDVLRLLYTTPEGYRGRRFTQDSPVLPDVWLCFGMEGPESPRDLLLTPNSASSMSRLVIELRERLAAERNQKADDIFIGYNESHVLVTVNFRELIRAIVPLSPWWKTATETLGVEALRSLSESTDLVSLLTDPARHFHGPEGADGITTDVLDLIRIAGGILLQEPMPEQSRQNPESAEALRDYFRRALAEVIRLLTEPFWPPARDEARDGDEPPLWSVNDNREIEAAVSASRMSIKADAAIRLFNISCEEIVWAVVDSGIDAKHEAFAQWPKTEPAASETKPPERRSRVLKTYDFTLLSVLQEAAFRPDALSAEQSERLKGFDQERLAEFTRDLKKRLLLGRPLEWDRLDEFLSVDTETEQFEASNQHGTHVAGILAADWRKPERVVPYEGYRGPKKASVTGVCPDIRLYDLRVIAPGGRGSEFAILAALQFVRYLNMNRDKMVVHGVNLSFSLPHNVKSYACGSTPVCQECERLVNSGVVVVTAAGNRGYSLESDQFESYRAMTITDPGNADAVITVGATHRMEPHRYGVSYFSSRGPTGDGRLKPDLVAPGEKISSVTPGNGPPVELDGTSMAAPHASGAAALLMARHSELLGKPQRVKDILCRTATDLGRDRAFQGAGMLDVLRALQSV